MIDKLKDFRWMQMYIKAKKYKKQFGNLNVPKNYDKKLFNWIRTQRIAYKNRFIPKEQRTNNFLPLTDERVKLLENIGIEWEPSKNSNDEIWMKMYKEAKKYSEEYGTLCEILNNKNLKKWLRIQILSYNNRTIKEEERPNNYLPLSDEKVELLERIGMKWKQEKGGMNRIWLEMYEEAKKYYLQYGNLIVSTNYETKNGKKLGFWLHHQRQAYKNRNIPKKYRKNGLAPLTDEQVQMLEKIGMVWNANNKIVRWNLNYEIAKKFYQENGHLIVPKSLKTIYGKSEYQWIRDQQKAVDYDKLSEEQVLLLSEIGIKKKKKLEEYTWDECYKKAEEFYHENGHLNIPKKYITTNGMKLGLWLDRQIKSYRKDLENENKILSTKQIELLENIDIAWERKKTSEEIWNEKYKKAEEFYKKNGHLNPSQFSATKEESEIYRWINFQKKAYKNRNVPEELRYFKAKPLTNEQIILLENIGMKWEDEEKKHDEIWNINFELAQEIYKEKGNINQMSSIKTPKEFKIKNWLKEQRLLNKKGLLTKEQIEKLESIGIIWNLQEYNFVTKPINLEKKLKIEKRFLEFLSKYAKEHKNEIESYEDVLNITNSFFETFGNKENHYRKK